MFSGCRAFYVLTLYATVSSTVVPLETLVYNTRSNTWTFWEHSSSGINEFPLVSWTQANDVSGTYITTGKGILSNGDVIECYDDFFPQDRATGVLVFEATTFADGVFVTTSDTGDQITLKVRVGHQNFETHNRKFMHELRPICDATEDTQTLSVSYADDNHETFITPRTINLSNANDKLTRLGQFRRRTFQLEYSGDEPLRLEGLEVEIVGAGV